MPLALPPLCIKASTSTAMPGDVIVSGPSSTYDHPSNFILVAPLMQIHPMIARS